MIVSVVYATPAAQTLIDIELPEGACVKDAIECSGILSLFPGLPINSVGIFGKKTTLETILSDGDRVEIYRPLKIDPKEARRSRGK